MNLGRIVWVVMCGIIVACTEERSSVETPESLYRAGKIEQLAQTSDYTFHAGEGAYEVHFNYTGEDWWRSDVGGIHVNTAKPIAIIPMQYTNGGMMPGAFVEGRNIGQLWNSITQEELAERLVAKGFVVFTPTITQYGENLDGFQAFEHFIAGIHKGSACVQTVLLTADADVPNQENPLPGAQMLVTGTNERNSAWEAVIQKHVNPFYESTGLGNQGARVRGGHSMEEGSSAAWHPMIERAAQHQNTVTIMEASRGSDIVREAGSIEAGREWAAPLFDAIVAGMVEWTEVSEACQ